MISKYFEPAYTDRYCAVGFYDDDLRGVADSFRTDDFDELRDRVHDMLCDGDVVVVNDYETGGQLKITPDDYFAGFEGEGIQEYMFN